MSAPENHSSAAGDAVVLENVSKHFRPGGRTVKALDSLTAKVRPGTVTGFVGPDGGGKTTLFRLMAGLLVPDDGSIHIFHTDVVRQPLLVQQWIGYMPQRFGLYEDLTVRENLDLYADLQGLPSDERPERYKTLMEMTGLGPFTGRIAGALSGGMKQKLGLSCTLVSSPRLLLLDEPTVGVDPVSRRELWAIVYRMVEEEEMTVLLSTAYLDEAERCREVILIHQGRVLGQGDPRSLREAMKGRTYQVTAPGINKRSLQEKLIAAPGIVDAIIQGGGVRVVSESPAEPVAADIVPGLSDVDIQPVAPRFEDRFIVMLKDETGTSPVKMVGLKAKVSATRESGDVIVVKNIKRRFGTFYAVKGISFTVRHGEVFGLLGANGAGKSTTFRMLCGLLPVSEGSLTVAGADLRRAAARARGRVGYMAQRFSLYGNLSVFENLRFFSSAYGLYGQRQRERMAWAVEAFELGDYAQAKSGDLPLGFKQRLSLAAALMHEPEILFLDEPTSGVDPLARREFWNRINALAQGGVTVLVTTHFMEEAEYCDRLVIMAEGEILEEGTPDDIKARHRSATQPEPSMEDAFIALIKEREGRSV